jgi:hypothetical protein
LEKIRKSGFQAIDDQEIIWLWNDAANHATTGSQAAKWAGLRALVAESLGIASPKPVSAVAGRVQEIPVKMFDFWPVG